MKYKAQYLFELNNTVVVDQDGYVQSVERCAQIMTDRDILRAILDERRTDLTRNAVTIADALTLLRWVSDCCQTVGELRPDFDDCVDAIRAFLAALATARKETK